MLTGLGLPVESNASIQWTGVVRERILFTSSPSISVYTKIQLLYTRSITRRSNDFFFYHSRNEYNKSVKLDWVISHLTLIQLSDYSARWTLSFSKTEFHLNEAIKTCQNRRCRHFYVFLLSCWRTNTAGGQDSSSSSFTFFKFYDRLFSLMFHSLSLSLRVTHEFRREHDTHLQSLFVRTV